jgi:Holliday junction resolvase RusA-like endonuclease
MRKDGAGMKIVVRGCPAPQGSKRHVGHGVMIESSKKVKPWRQDVVAAATNTVNFTPDSPFTPYDEPIIVRMVFSFVRPRSHYRSGRNAHLLKESAPKQPCGLPDLSKLLRSTEDALTTAQIWRDDSRVVEYERAAKVWCGEDPEALDSPGAVIVIRRLGSGVGPQDDSEIPF